MKQSVFLLVHNEEANSLVIQENPKHGLHLPGGKVERGEELFAALKRELSEEINGMPLLLPQDVKLIATTSAFGYEQYFYVPTCKYWQASFMNAFRASRLVLEHPLKVVNLNWLLEVIDHAGSVACAHGANALNNYLVEITEEDNFRQWRADLVSERSHTHGAYSDRLPEFDIEECEHGNIIGCCDVCKLGG